MAYVFRDNFTRVYSGVISSAFLILLFFAPSSYAQEYQYTCKAGSWRGWYTDPSGLAAQFSSSPAISSATCSYPGMCDVYQYISGTSGPTYFNPGQCTVIRRSTVCVDNPSLPQWSDEFQECVEADEPEPPPGCDESGQYSGGPGQVGGQIATTGAQQEQIAFCSPFYDFDDNQCSDVAGYVEFGGGRTQICNDDKNECAASGGTYGFVGSGSEQLAVCLPASLSDDLPTCDITTLQIDGATGSFVCASAPQPPDPDDPTADPGSNEPPGPSCIGPQCDASTGLCTGPNCIQYNGPPINSCTGPDCDTDTGDCVGPDCEETEIPSEQKSPESEVSGGGTCDVAPSCKGDAILCSINFQLWRQRCESTLDESQVSGSGACDGAPFVCQGDAIQCAILEQTRLARCASEGLFDTDFDLDGFTSANDPGQLFSSFDLNANGILDAIYNVPVTTGTCPPPIVLNVVGITLEISFQPFCNLAEMMRPFVLLLFGYLAFRIVMRAF